MFAVQIYEIIVHNNNYLKKKVRAVDIYNRYVDKQSFVISSAKHFILSIYFMYVLITCITCMLAAEP